MAKKEIKIYFENQKNDMIFLKNEKKEIIDTDCVFIDPMDATEYCKETFGDNCKIILEGGK